MKASSKTTLDYLDEQLPTRVWNKCIPEPNSGCWLWLGAERNGYPRMWIDGAMRSVQRFILTTIGNDVAGLVVRHCCDTPACINPTHLLLGTDLDNVRDRDSRGRHASAKVTRCPVGHAYSDWGVVRGGKRYCRMCQRARQKALYATRVPSVRPTRCSKCGVAGHRKSTCEVSRG